MRKDKLYWAIKKAGVVSNRAAEVGVLSFEASAIRGFVMEGVQCDLYEAVPEFCDKIALDVAAYKRTVLHRVAVSDYNGTLDLCMAGPSTFNAAQASSPAINHDGYDKSTAQTVTVKCVDFADVDTSDYDLVTVDVEGGEYSVLSRMRSRPTVIALETQSRDYCNPRLGAIADWMVENGYVVWIWNNTDTVFFKGDPPALGLEETLKARWHNYRYYAGRL